MQQQWRPERGAEYAPLMRALSLVLPAAVIAACGGNTTTPADANGASSTTPTKVCSDLATSARSTVEKAIAANDACKQDADCIDVALSASCFDSCGRAVNASGKAAVDAARAKADAEHCATFKQEGCKLIVPPCVPPSPPACVEGHCR